MPTMAEITENYPERLAALNAALGAVTMAEAARSIEAATAALRDSGFFISMRDLTAHREG